MSPFGHLLGDVSAADLVLELHVVFVNSSLVGENISNGSIQNLSSSAEILDSVLGNSDVSFDLVVVLFQVHGCLLLSLDNLWIGVSLLFFFQALLLDFNLLAEDIDFFLIGLDVLATLFLNFISVVMVFVLGDGSVHVLIHGLEISHLLVPFLLLYLENSFRMLLSKQLGLQILHLLELCLLLSLISLTDLLVFRLHDFDSVFLLFIGSLLFSNLFLSDLNGLLEVILLVVELLLECKEMLIQRDTVSKQGFVARGLILLVNLTIFQKFDFVFHKDDLFLKIQNVLFFEAR